MPNVFVEPSPDGGYQIVTSDGKTPEKGFATQAAAIDAARQQGHKPLVARVRELNDKDKPDHWRAA